LPRDHYVRLDSNDYSVHPSAIGRRVELIADTDQVQVHCDGRLVATHQRCWARHQSITDVDHARAAADLRAAHTARPAPTSDGVAVRELSDYDRVFGLTEEAA